jgi:alpha-beta hydrolase superfamily lysophospholipase
VSSCYEQARTIFNRVPVRMCCVSYAAALNIPAGDRSTFAEVVDIIALFMDEQRTARGAEAEVHLLGESMGGLLALGVAHARPDLVVRPPLCLR